MSIAGNAQDVLASFINRCQIAGLSASRGIEPGNALRQLRVLGYEIPAIDEPAGRLLLNHTLVHICLQAASAFKQSSDTREITTSLAVLVGAPDHSTRVGAYRRALSAIGQSGSDAVVGDARIATAVHVIRREHANPDLRLDDIARRVRLSKWHLNRLLYVTRAADSCSTSARSASITRGRCSPIPRSRSRRLPFRWATST